MLVRHAEQPHRVSTPIHQTSTSVSYSPVCETVAGFSLIIEVQCPAAPTIFGKYLTSRSV